MYGDSEQERIIRRILAVMSAVVNGEARYYHDYIDTGTLRLNVLETDLQDAVREEFARPKMR